MLKEVQGDTHVFRVGDAVKIISTGAIGTIVDIENGQWMVKTTVGGTVLAESTQLERRRVLMG